MPTPEPDSGDARVEPLPAGAERVRFCSRCGALAGGEPPERPTQARVCTDCGMGVYLDSTRGALGTLGTFFLVVTADLRIRAVSEGAESVFGHEDALVGRAVTSLLTTPLGEERLSRAVRRAACGARDSVAVPISAATAEARRFGPLDARVSPCGPPRAALIAIEPGPA